MTYKELIKSNLLVRRILTLQFIVYFGAWFSDVAIYSMLVKYQASAFLIASVTAMHFLPSIILAPFSGAIIDTFDRKKLMISLCVIEIFCTAGLFTVHSLELAWLLMILVFIRMGASAMFFLSGMSLTPQLVQGIALQRTNELHSIIWSVTYASGMGLGGLVVNYFGIKASFMIDILFFILAISVLFITNFNIKPAIFRENFLKTIKDGFNYIIKNKVVLNLILLHASVGLTAFDTLVTLLADYRYKYIIATSLAIGITNAIRAIALAIGPLVLGKIVNKKILFYIFIFQGLGIALWGVLEGNFYLSLLGVFCTGFSTATLWSFTYNLIQTNIEQKYLGRVLAYNDMVFMLSNVATTFFIGFASSYMSLQNITFCLAGMFFIVALYYKKVQKYF